MNDHGHRANGRVLFAVLLAVLLALVALAVFINSRPEPVQPTKVAPAPSAAAVPKARALLERRAPAPEATSCGPPELSVGDTVRTAFVGLDEVSWLTHVPSSYAPQERHPLLVLLHQNHETAEQFLDYSGFRPLAAEHQFVVVAPMADQVNTWESQHAVDVVDRIVKDSIDTLCIDPSRVFAVGHGAGGEIAMELSCEPWVTAIATNSYREAANREFCGLVPRPKPHLMLSPLSSAREPVEGGLACGRKTGTPLASLAAVERTWLQRNRCDSQSQKRSGSCITWTCAAPFKSCHLDGGHPWPGAPPRGEPATQRCDGEPPRYATAAEVWKFFSNL